MTLANLRDACKGEFGLAEGVDDAYLADAQWTRAINRGYRWLCRHAKLIAHTWTITTHAATREEAISGLTPGLAGIDKVLFQQGGTVWTPLSFLDAGQIATAAANVHDTTGAPTTYYTRGAGLLGFYPIPDAANAGALCEVWGWAYPTALAADGDTPAIDSNLHEWLEGPAKYELAKQLLTRTGGQVGGALVALYDRERQAALLECRDFVDGLADEPRYVNTSGEEYW